MPGSSAPPPTEPGPAAALEQVSAFYDADPEREWRRTQDGPYHRLEFEVLHQTVLPGILAPASRVLDIGCGPGRHALALAAQGHYVALADISAACLDSARRRLHEAGLSGQLLDVQHTSAASLAAAPGSYDAALLFGPLYHLTDDADARVCVARAAAALRPGGHLLAIFLTRTSVIRDLIKRGRFSEIRTLLETGYLSHGRYSPISAESQADYMPPTRTYQLAEACDLLTAAGLEITAVHSLEGVAAWMRPYVDKAAVDPGDFRELSAVVRATASLPELIEAGDHFVLTAHRPAHRPEYHADLAGKLDGVRILARYLPVSAACLHCQGENTAVVTEYPEGAPLSALAIDDQDRFGAILADVTARLTSAAEATLVPARDAGEPNRTLQTPAVLAGWTDDIAKRLAPWRDHYLRLDDVPLGLTLGDITASSRQLTARPPEALSYSTGDLHLGNIRVAPGSTRWWLLDLEFAGLYDLDYTIAGLLSSCLTHPGLITGAAAEASDGEIRLTASLAGEWGRRLLATTWLLDRFTVLPADPARIFAFVVPGLRFRLVADDVPRSGLPAVGLAALALAAQMTRQERPTCPAGPTL